MKDPQPGTLSVTIGCQRVPGAKTRELGTKLDWHRWVLESNRKCSEDAEKEGTTPALVAFALSWSVPSLFLHSLIYSLHEYVRSTVSTPSTGS